MGHTHTTFYYNSPLDFEEKFNTFYLEVKKIIEEFIKEYNDCEVLYIQFMYITIKSFPDLEIKDINNLKLNKAMLNIRDLTLNQLLLLWWKII